MGDVLNSEMLGGAIEAVSRGFGRFGDPLALFALGFGAVAALARVRLLTFACLAAGATGIWMFVQGLAYVELPLPVSAGLGLLLIAGMAEAVVVAVGGREAAPTFWASLLLALTAFFLLGPARLGLRLGGALAGAGGVFSRLLASRRSR